MLHSLPAWRPVSHDTAAAAAAPQARHTGIKITQQIAILMGCAVLPHLKSMVDIIKHGLVDENQKVRAAGRGSVWRHGCGHVNQLETCSLQPLIRNLSWWTGWTGNAACRLARRHATRDAFCAVCQGI